MRLFLCEKPSQGKDIGRILGATQRGEGCLSGSGVIVTWCIGHLIEAAPPEVYDAALKRWSLEQLPIIPQQWRVEVKPKAGYDGVLSVGRVQTPTLKLVVDRDREIAAFKSVPFWAIDVSLSEGGRAFSAQWVPPDDCTDDAGRCLQQPIAQQAAQQIRVAGTAQVVSVETERVREGPPLLFDLGTLQEVCSKQLGLDVQETLEIAQVLYESHKATTYPRSDSGYLPESMFAEVPTVLDSLLKTDPSLHPIMGQLDRSQRSRVWNDGKVTAHHGIIPTLEPANLSAMSEKELPTSVCSNPLGLWLLQDASSSGSTGPGSGSTPMR